jgi:hypothetical protein
MYWSPLKFRAPVLLEGRERRAFEVPGDGDNGYGTRIPIRRTFAELMIPFQGDSAMFHVQPSSHHSTDLPAHIQQGVVKHVISLDHRTPEQGKNELDTFEREFDATFRALCSDFRAANTRLHGFTVQALDARRKRLLELRNFDDRLR